MVTIPWTNPKTWSGSEVLTSGDMNQYVGSNFNYLYDNYTLSNQWKVGTTNVTQENQRIERGSQQIEFVTSSYGSIWVSFNTAFGTAPTVVSTCGGETWRFASPLTINGTGARIYAYKVSTGTITDTCLINWIAMGA